jgi:putative DNA primase/helicase
MKHREPTPEARIAGLMVEVAPPETLPPECSEDSLALAFSATHDGRLLYVPAWGFWLVWDGKRWAQDRKLTTMDLSRRICREAAANQAESQQQRLAQRLASAQTVAAVEKLARSDVRHSRRAEDFDADPWVLNTPGGVVDLKTGIIRPARKDELFTKITAATPGGDCLRWLVFLDELTGGNREMVAYLQRLLGYCLTGETREHMFAFFSGAGGNGKSVLLNTITAAMGDYAAVAMMDLFVATRGEQHPTGLASLRGSRLVVAQETEEGRAWAEARIKSITGGDPITARYMRMDPFTFQPGFKLMISGNHRPVLRNPDPAMRRRLHLIPCDHVPPSPDPQLAAKLKEELGGILAWAVEGCLAWQRDGLLPPAIVTETTNSYFEDQDSFEQWLVERCDCRKTSAALGATEAFKDWRRWAEERGEAPGAQKRFSGLMARRFTKQRTRTGVQFLGVALLPSYGEASGR